MVPWAGVTRVRIPDGNCTLFRKRIRCPKGRLEVDRRCSPDEPPYRPSSYGARASVTRTASFDSPHYGVGPLPVTLAGIQRLPASRTGSIRALAVTENPLIA